MCKLLLVDDEEMIRVCVGAILEMTGHEVIFARDGQEAIDIYEKNRDQINLVVMDITMPKMDGVDAAKVMKKIDPSVKVVLMSGQTERDFNEATADAFIPKPFSARDICGVVQRILGRDLIPSVDLAAMGATG